MCYSFKTKKTPLREYFSKKRLCFNAVKNKANRARCQDVKMKFVYKNFTNQTQISRKMMKKVVLPSRTLCPHNYSFISTAKTQS